MFNTMEKINPRQEISQRYFGILGTKNEDNKVQETVAPHRKKTKGIPRIRVKEDPKVTINVHQQRGQCSPDGSKLGSGNPIFGNIKLRK